VKTSLPAKGDHPAEPAQFVRERIVRAKNEAAALKHVVADTITIDRATIDDAMRLAGQGGKVEEAK
jgi:hypothetical protein